MADAQIEPETLPRCDKLDGSTLKIVPSYTEAGLFCEANCITVTDGERTAVYVPYRVVVPVSTYAQNQPGLDEVTP